MVTRPDVCSFLTQYYNLNGKAPHITYEYTVPRPAGTTPLTPASLTPEQPQLSSLVSGGRGEPGGANQEGRGGSTQNLTDVLYNDLESFGEDLRP